MTQKKYILLFVFIYTSVNSQPRVFALTEAEEGQLPYVVHVHARSFCSCMGSIIHEEWVLSAGHCVTDKNGNVLEPYRLKIAAGTVDFEVGITVQVRTAKKVIRHDKYRLSVGKHDISLLRTEKPFSFNKYVNKIEFMASSWSHGNSNTWENCLSVSWGTTENGGPTRIKYVNTTAGHGKGTCPCIEKNYKLKRIVCLPSLQDQGICFGDSGGALVCDGKIVGVAHVIIDKRSCNYKRPPDKKIDCGSNHIYGTYMYTCPYLDWISGIVPEVPSKPYSCKGIIHYKPSGLQIIIITLMLSVFVTIT